ncbi:Organic Anion Transporter Polypeptide (OATP) family protein [Brugia pahangi]
MSKYLERQFSVAPSKADMLINCIMIPMAGIGTMFSGFIIQRFRLGCVKTLKFCIALLMCTLILSPMYLVYCDHDPLAGIEEHYEMDVASNSDQNNNATEILPFLKSTCSRHCDCVPSEYYPVSTEFYNEKFGCRTVKNGLSKCRVNQKQLIMLSVHLRLEFSGFDVCSGKQGSCMLYQNKLLADLFLTFRVIGQTIAMVSNLYIIIFLITNA